MRFVVDTNILLYAVNESCREHESAKEFVERQVCELIPFCLTWGVVYEFLRVSTHPRVFPRPLDSSDALDFVGKLLSLETVNVLQETIRHFRVLETTLSELNRPSGNLFHAIHTAVLAREHGVPEIVTADPDFLQFNFVRLTNPVA